MSFLDKYLNQNRLAALPDRIKEALQALEDLIKEDMNQGGGNFDECVKIFGPQIADVVQRLAEKIGTLSIHSIRDAIDALKFAKNIGFEIYQIVESVKDCVVQPGLSEEESKARQIEFGKDLAYFVWLTADPLGGKLNWLPFKKAIEKRLVRWIAGMGMELAYEVISKNPIFAKAATEHKYLRAL